MQKNPDNLSWKSRGLLPRRVCVQKESKSYRDIGSTVQLGVYVTNTSPQNMLCVTACWERLNSQHFY